MRSFIPLYSSAIQCYSPFSQANVSSSLPVKPAKPEDDKSPPRRELKRENNLIAAAAASTTKEDQPSPVDSAVPGASKDVMVSEPMKVAESVPAKRDPPVKRNIEFTKEDLERIEKETHLVRGFYSPAVPFTKPLPNSCSWMTTRR